MEDTLQNSIGTKRLYKEYDWYQTAVPTLVQNACDGFFTEMFRVILIGISQNINCLIDNESCFVTKIRISDEYDMFCRITDKALDIILNGALGPSKNKFNINKISDLESKIITCFNDFMYENLKPLINEPEGIELKRTNFDTVHLTFLIREVDERNYRTGKVVVSLPKALLRPNSVESTQEKFSGSDFPNCLTPVKVLVGKYKFLLRDIKALEPEDVVVFENSNVNSMTISLNGILMPVKLNPNMDLLIPDYDGGNEMEDARQNIWDSIEVDMTAEFDAVKITLGELKDIEDGLVVDITSLYDNNVILKVDGKPIASGSLVIVNDRYGVKINNIITDDLKNKAPKEEEQTIEQEGMPADYEEQSQQAPQQEMQEASGGNEEEEFDYSDFELEDDNI